LIKHEVAQLKKNSSIEIDAKFAEMQISDELLKINIDQINKNHLYCSIITLSVKDASSIKLTTNEDIKDILVLRNRWNNLAKLIFLI
jgi:hypothetical protein